MGREAAWAGRQIESPVEPDDLLRGTNERCDIRFGRLERRRTAMCGNAQLAAVRVTLRLTARCGLAGFRGG